MITTIGYGILLITAVVMIFDWAKEIYLESIENPPALPPGVHVSPTVAPRATSKAPEKTQESMTPEDPERAAALRAAEIELDEWLGVVPEKPEALELKDIHR